MTRRDELMEELVRAGAAEDEARSLHSVAHAIGGPARVPVPPSRHERALFVEGAAGRPRRVPVRVFVPAMAAMLLLVAIAIAGRTAVPGQALYPVRQALDSVGLAQDVSGSVRAHIADARSLIARAQTSIASGRRRLGLTLAARSLFELGRARDLASGLVGEARSDALTTIARLKGTALGLLQAQSLTAQAGGSHDDHGSHSGEGHSGDDSGGSSHSGSDDGSSSGSGGTDDSSGSGSSGSGSSGSGSSGSSGSGSSGSGSSGSGSGSSGSGSSGSSGSGSGSSGSGSSGSGSSGSDSSGSDTSASSGSSDDSGSSGSRD